MIEFNPEKMTHEVVYIRSINRLSIEVVSAEDKVTQWIPKNPNVKYRVNKTGTTSVEIHQKIFALYKSKNSLLKFSGEGRKAYLFFYGEHIIVIDVCNTFSYLRDSWKSLLVDAFKKIQDTITSDTLFEKNIKIYFDGEFIFYMSNKSYEMKHPDFKYRCVRAIHLARMAIKTNSVDKSKVKMKEPNQSVDDMVKALDNKAEMERMREERRKYNEELEKTRQVDTSIVLKDGIVICYTPFEDKSIEVISPVFTETEKNLSKKKSQMGEMFAHKILAELFNKMSESSDKMRYTLSFAIKAGKIIGRHYGFKETEFLDIPSIVLKTGIINLTSEISQTSKTNYTLDFDFYDGMAYLMRFFHRETDMNKFRDLSNLFNTTLRYSLILIKDEISENDIYAKNNVDKVVPKTVVSEFKKDWNPSKAKFYGARKASNKSNVGINI